MWNEGAFGMCQAGCADGSEAQCEGTARVGEREENHTGMTRRLELRPSMFKKTGCAPRLLRTGSRLVKLGLPSGPDTHTLTSRSATETGITPRTNET